MSLEHPYLLAINVTSLEKHGSDGGECGWGGLTAAAEKKMYKKQNPFGERAKHEKKKFEF